MIRLHAQFLGSRTTTDVLSFLVEETNREIDAEIYICVDAIRRQARAHEVTPENEAVRLAVHGALHILGFDDHAVRARARMWRAQEAIVDAVVGAGSVDRKTTDVNFERRLHRA